MKKIIKKKNGEKYVGNFFTVTKNQLHIILNPTVQADISPAKHVTVMNCIMPVQHTSVQFGLLQP